MSNNLIKKDLAPLLRLAIPLALTGIIQSSVYFFETLFLAHLNETVLAAGALVSWLYGTIAVIMFGVLGSVNVLVAHKHGARKDHDIPFILRDGLCLAILLAIPTFILFWYMAEFFVWFGQAPSIAILSKAYLHALAWGLLPNFILIVLLDFMIGLGHARAVMVFTIISVIINLFFSFALIFGKFGFPALAIAGAGWGMTLSYWLTMLALAVYVCVDSHYKHYSSKIWTLQGPAYFHELMQLGLPLGLMYCIEVGFFFVMTLVMGRIDVQALAANQIALQYMSVLMSLVFSIAQAITVRMGHLLGAHQLMAAERTAYLGILISAGMMLITSFIYLCYPMQLIAIDINVHNPQNALTVQYAIQFLYICALFQIFEATRIAMFGALRGLKDTHFTLITSMISFWFLALPIGYLLALPYGLGGKGLWWGLVIGASCSVIILYQRLKLKLHRFHRKHSI